jgi:prolyl-tRNA synthetase
MLFSRALIPTIKEAPQDATNVSHTLLTRAGFIRRVGAGFYDYLPLGFRVLKKVEGIVRSEMDRAGALEILMPALLPAELFKETGRFDSFGDNLFRLKDRKGSELHLGPTHEEVVTDIARREIRSYRDLPKNLYQIQSKFRDEPRPRGGLLRCREFIMKDAYSFDTSEEAARISYERMRQAYCAVYDRMGLNYRMVQADSGAMGGSTSAEFQVLAESGEDAIVACDTCGYAANVEVAKVRPGAVASADATTMTMRKVATPGKKTILEIATFLDVSPVSTLKALLYLAGDDVVMALVRGDHSLNEIALARACGVSEVHLASDADIKKSGAIAGYAGPIGFAGRVFVDSTAARARNMVCGANEIDTHIVNVNYGRDFQGQIADLRLAESGDGCGNCAAGTLTAYKGIEAGHIFILGTHYSAKMGATYLDEAQAVKPIVMGCYGIGVSRLVATTIEQHHDAEGMRWPMSLAPYQIHICTLGKEPAVAAAAQELYDALGKLGVEVLWDDRDERPGVKFKDADLIGIPLRVTIGGKGLAAGNIELKPRSEPDPKKAEMLPIATAAAELASRVHAALAAR